MRLLHLCENMQWASLPVAGGIYDQHPKLISEWEEIFTIRAEVERKKSEREKRQGNQNKPKRGRRR